MSDDIPKIPDHEELEKELSDYLTKKYGYRIKVISPMMMPQTKDTQEALKKTDLSEKIKFDLKPEELESYLDQYVIKQDEAKAVLATKICTHYNRIKYQFRKGRSSREPMVGSVKNNVLLIGPTGVGKTYLVKLIAQKLGVPFVKGDATKFSETGYVGGDVEDLVRELVVEAGDDIELAQCGIIYVDEVDKIASSHQIIGPDVSRTGVQRALLKPMEETEVDLKVAHDPISQIQAIEHYRKTGKREKRTVNTRNILFIMSGAFNDLAPIVKRRLQKQGIGFGAQIHSKEDDVKSLKQVKAEDMIEYGFESEFVGRIPVIAVLEPLEVEDLYQILRNPNNPIILGKKEDFRSYGIDIKFDDEALHCLAAKAYEERTGARGLVSVIERVLLPFEKSLPSSSIRYLVITREVVEHPQEELKRLLKDPDDPIRVQRYQRMLNEEKSALLDQLSKKQSHYIQNYPLVFTPERVELVVDHHLRTGLPIEGIFDETILLYNQIKVFESDFFERYGFKVRFDEEAVNEIISRALQRDSSATVICHGISRDYDYGFKLIFDRTGQTEFVAPKMAVVHPQVFMDELIRESYRHNPFNSGESD
ncbi:MAG: AAA domain-containing protein [Deltaproteobacteria bacterium]|nr:AAA domain-containing protein [Deltaproteobacteria bacterium]